MAKEQKTKAEVYREERKRRLAKVQKDKARNTPGKRKAKVVVKRVLVSFVSVVVALAIAATITFATGVPNRYLPAFSLGENNITVAEYNFNYFTAYQSLAQQYSSSLSSFGLDPTKSFREQSCMFNGSTWDKYFKDQAISQITNDTVLVDLANKEGITLTDVDKENVDLFVESVENLCKNQKMKVSEVFGKGVTMENVREYYEKYVLAERYKTYKLSTYEYDDSAILAGYQESKDSYDIVDYRTFSFAVETEEGADEATVEEAKKAAATEAKKMLAEITNEASFATLAEKYASEDDKEKYEDETATLNKKAPKAGISSSDVSAWLFDAARKTGDKTVIESDTEATVLYCIKPRYADGTQTVNVKHILISNQSEEANPTEEDLEKLDKEASEKAKQLLETISSGNKTEDGFTSFVAENTDDVASIDNGGLYENVIPGKTVDEFDAWIFDKSRKTGDMDIVATDYGYHLIYFIGEGLPVWKVNVKDTLTNKDYQDFYTETAATYTKTENSFGLWLSGRN